MIFINVFTKRLTSSGIALICTVTVYFILHCSVCLALLFRFPKRLHTCQTVVNLLMQ